MCNWVFRLFGVVILLAALVPGVLGQTTLGGVKGTIHDPAGLVVNAAVVTLISVDTGTSRHTKSDVSGLYDFPDVPPGKYQVKLEQPGFQPWIGELTLHTQEVAVVDAILVLGTAATKVEVTAVASTISQEAANLSDVTESARIRELPLNGFFVENLFALSPGVEPGNYSPHVNGLAPGAADVLVDGGSVVDRQRGGLPRIDPPLDSIEEFTIDQNSTAQYSRPVTITMTTKSGTNNLHGSLFEKWRNDAYGLRSRRREETVIPPYKRNEFGASAGGPVILPLLYNGKHKTFWFFSYQGLRQRQSTSVISAVPTDAMWNGDFSGLVDGLGNVYTLYNPFTTTGTGSRTAYAGNLLTAQTTGARLTPQTTGPNGTTNNPLWAYLSAHTPRPTNNVNPLIGNNYFATEATPFDQNQYTTKIDHHFGESNTVFGRITVSNSFTSQYLGNGPNSPDGSYNTSAENDHLYNGAISYLHMFSSTILNEFIFAGQRSNSIVGGALDGTNFDPLLGFANPLSETGWPTLTVDGFSNRIYWDSQNKTPEHLNKLVPEDNLTVVRGKHEIRTGLRWSFERNNTRQSQQGQGRYKYAGDLTSLGDPVAQQGLPFTGNGLADLELGWGQYYRINFNRPYYYLQQSELGFYGQDTWKVTPRFTLNYGLRWDYWTPFLERSHRFINLDISKFATTTTVITPAGHPIDTLGLPASLIASYASAGMTFTTADKAGFPSGLLASDKGDFAPRIGAAFKLDNKSVIRGSYGMYYWTVPMAQILLGQGFSAPLQLDYQTNQGDGNVFQGVTNWDVFNPPAPQFEIGSGNMVDINSPQSSAPPFPFTPLDRNWKNARVQEWHLTYEREIGQRTAFRVSYIGNHGSDIMQTVQMNAQQSTYLYSLRTGQPLPNDINQLRLNPFWQDLLYRTPIGYSNSNSLQVNVQRQAYKGLQYQVYYTFDRALSTADNSQGYSSQPGLTVPDPRTVIGGSNMSLHALQRLVYTNVSGTPEHSVGWNAIYDLPFGRGKAFGSGVGRALNHVIGGWQIATIGYYSSGHWLTPNNSSICCFPAGDFQMVRDPRLSNSQRVKFNYGGTPSQMWFAGDFSPSQCQAQCAPLANYTPALIVPGTNQDGFVSVPINGVPTDVIYDPYTSIPQNFIKGPSHWGDDFSLFKTFGISENVRLRFTADAFNVFNHPNNVDPDPTTGLIPLNVSASDPRTIQFSLRLDF